MGITLFLRTFSKLFHPFPHSSASSIVYSMAAPLVNSPFIQFYMLQKHRDLTNSMKKRLWPLMVYCFQRSDTINAVHLSHFCTTMSLILSFRRNVKMKNIKDHLHSVRLAPCCNPFSHVSKLLDGLWIVPSLRMFVASKAKMRTFFA